MKSYLLIFAILLSSVSLLAQTPTISSLVVTGSGVKWYDAPTGGTQYTSPATTNLVNGQIYYASQTVNGVESNARVAVTANLTTVAAPATGTHTPSQTQVIWNWNAVSGASGYKWSTANVYSGATDMSNVLTKPETSLTCNTAYTRYIWAYNGSGCVSAVTTLTQSTSSCSVTSLTFNYTGGLQTYTVPVGVTSLLIEAWGAQGGTSDGGMGGYATGNLSVSPGQVLNVYVGGQGATNGSNGTAGGWNGGGRGGNSTMGSSGGGASDVRVAGTALTNRVIVAGGGGGFDYETPVAYGGAGGGLTGLDAYGTVIVSTGGTQLAGGTGGNANSVVGENGSLGNGGGNALYSGSTYQYGGGGGGGYYGGGGGSPWCGGGGGSSYIGGVTSGSTTAGMRSGNGEIKIAYNVSAGSSWTFTNASSTGRTGPTQVQVNAAYTGTSLEGGVVINTQGIQEWTVPVTGSYSIRASGAQGARSGGLGADITGTFSLTQGEIIKIVVGQTGVDGSSSGTMGGGGGGGSYVVRAPYSNVASILVAAGGGGGYTNTGVTTTMNAFSTESGGSTYSSGGGTSGNGGNSGIANGAAAGGGGFLTDGTSGAEGDVYSGGGKSFLNGAVGGNEGHTLGLNGGDGGFGGGGGGWHNTLNRSGGGGGYSGGQGGTWSGQQSGGGGGSINAGTSQTNTAASRSGNGQVIITKL